MEYLIGAGAILESGEHGSITPATLHAHVDDALARRVAVAAIDFEGCAAESLRRLVVLAQGWNARQFRTSVSDKLREQRECDLGDVLGTLAAAAGSTEVHVFAHWLPDEGTCSKLRSRGVEIVTHPLESISEASLVAGQRHRRWRAA